MMWRASAVSVRALTAVAILACGAAVLATPALAQTVTAEPWFRAGTWMFAAELGGAAYSDFQRSLARAVSPDSEIPDFHRRVSGATTVTGGASVTWWIRNGWGIRAAGSYTPTRFSVWNEEHGQKALDDGGATRPTYAKLATWTAAANVVFRFPRTLARVVPYGIVGAGMVQHRIVDDEELPPEARSAFADRQWRAPAGVFGVGAVVPLQRNNLLLTFELTNHLTEAPLRGNGTGERFELAGHELELVEDDDRGRDDVSLTNYLRLTIGLTLPVR
jgi:uncharacterized protein YjeT (DUF2065 family)